MWIAAIIDTTAAAKLLIYDEKTAAKLTPMATYIIRNVTSKTTHFTTNSSFQLFRTAKAEVDQQKVQEACDLLHPPAPPVISIAEAKTSPVKKLVSVRGQVVQDEPVQMVGDNIPLRHVTLKDTTASVQLSLWRDMADTHLNPGNYIEVRSVYVSSNPIKKETQLGSTQTTVIEQQPLPVETHTGTLTAFDITDTECSLIIDDQQYQSTTTNLQELIPDNDEDDIETELCLTFFHFQLITHACQQTSKFFLLLPPNRNEHV
ncbi:uncharacterized protein LOC135489942 [Lineus longissimus]|uniref:uncharacterized protein LOC135489942 n=1 Tax=Lineus longissimus TaxID=88925 RepID=UPI00315D7965